MTRAEADALRAILSSLMGLAAAADAILSREDSPAPLTVEDTTPAGPRWLGDTPSPEPNDG